MGQMQVFVPGEMTAMARPPKAEAAPILNGWKEIATYLGKGVRTVQRYERLMGLPIRRPASKSRAAVVATKSELDAWVAASPIREAFQLPHSAAYSAAHSAEIMRLKLKQMGALRDEMTALRAELKASMESLRQSIENMRVGLRHGHWEVSALSLLETSPEARRLARWLSNEASGLSVETKGRKAS